jgi:GT2 family glycosyltransferase
MILTAVPFSRDRNLGRAYNDVMGLVPDGGWACLLDHDMMFTTPNWYSQLEAAIDYDPRGAYTCVTNRIASAWQRAPSSRDFDDDYREHRALGDKIFNEKQGVYTDVTETPMGWGGVMMLLSKDAWLEVGGFVNGMMCVDHVMHYALRTAGRRIYCIDGLYAYHFRGTSSTNAWKTMPKAVDPRTGQPCAHRF